MPSVEGMRQFVNERLTAAAEEIFRVFEKTIVEYEEELDRQRRLLSNVIAWNPKIKLHIIELPQQHVCEEEEEEEEEVLADQQQMCNVTQERNSSLAQEEPYPPQIKEEQEELCVSQEGEKLTLKQETGAFMWTPTYEESGRSEDQTLNLSTNETQCVVEETCLNYIPVNRSVVSEPNTDLLLVSHETASQDQNRAERYHKSRSQSNGVNNPSLSEIHKVSDTGRRFFKCDKCGRVYQYNSLLQRHLRTHTDEKPYSCKTCGKAFKCNSTLKVHMRIHTGEKPHTCKICWEDFERIYDLNVHMRIHTGGKPYSCKTCGKDFRRNYTLKIHMRTHTGEKPYHCKTCGRRFSHLSALIRHMRVHTGEKAYSCELWGQFQT